MLPIPLITTTVRTGHNPGDTFIGVGMQYLFEQALGPQQWLLVDRFGPAGFREQESAIRAAPFVVYGGMPQYNNFDEWMHWYDWAMWRDYLLRWRLRVFAMAGGAGSRLGAVSVEDWVAGCLRSRRTVRILAARGRAVVCCTVRDPYAHALLNALGIGNRHLPCAALWATHMWGLRPAAERPYLLVVPPSLGRAAARWRVSARAASRRATAAAWAALHLALREVQGPVRMLCHTLRDYQALRGLIPDDELWHHGDAYTLLRQYTAAHTVLSARLHASLPAYGLVGTRVAHVSADVRGSAVEILPKIVHVRDAAPQPARVLSEMERLEPSREEDLRPWEEAYREAILESVPHGGGG
jgi:hypothetical protein